MQNNANREINNTNETILTTQLFILIFLNKFPATGKKSQGKIGNQPPINKL